MDVVMLLLLLPVFSCVKGQGGGGASVNLSSTLYEQNIAYDSQTVIFTCITHGSNILEWNSVQYIDQNREPLQFLESDDIGMSRNSNTHQTTIARLVNNTYHQDSGAPVLVSTLTIIIRRDLVGHSSAVSCGINGHGPPQTINITTRHAVTLRSSLGHNVAYPGQVITFDCITRASEILEWSSEEYINIHGFPIQLFTNDMEGATTASSTHPTTLATLVGITEENGAPVISSRLSITVDRRFLHRTSSVTCGNNGHGSIRSFHFRTNDSVSLSSTLQGRNATDGEIITFTCVVRVSDYVVWRSVEHIGEGNYHLRLYTQGSVETSVYVPTTSAMMLSLTTENGINKIISLLRIIANATYPTSTVTCRGHDVAERKSIIFKTSESLTDGMETTTSYQQTNMSITMTNTLSETVTVPDGSVRTGMTGIGIIWFSVCLAFMELVG